MESRFKVGDRVSANTGSKWEKHGDVVEIGQPGNPTRTRVKWGNGVRTWFKQDALKRVIKA